jgi:glycerophosphoryl diester phosphodiesterase
MLITAHSGCDGTPANSLEFLEHAVNTGADALEIDVRRGREGTLFLGHDEAGTLTLRQAFRFLAGYPSIRINCDLKNPYLEQAVYETGLKFGLEDRLIYTGTVSVNSSVPVEIWLNIEEHVQDFYVNLLKDRDFEYEAEKQMASLCHAHDIPVVNIYEKAASHRLIDLFQKDDISLSVWTVDDEERMQELLKEPVKNITTRKPMDVIRLRKAMK